MDRIDLANLDTATLIEMLIQAREAAPVAQEVVLSLPDAPDAPVADSPTPHKAGWGEAQDVAPERCPNAGVTVDLSTVRSLSVATGVRLLMPFAAHYGSASFTTPEAWEAVGQHIPSPGGTKAHYGSYAAFSVAMTNRLRTMNDALPEALRPVVIESGKPCRFTINLLALAQLASKLNIR